MCEVGVRHCCSWFKDDFLKKKVLLWTIFNSQFVGVSTIPKPRVCFVRALLNCEQMSGPMGKVRIGFILDELLSFP